MANRIIRRLTPITTAKNATTAMRTKRPVSGRAVEADAVICRPSAVLALRSHEVIGGGGNLAKTNVGYAKRHGCGFLRLFAERCRYQHAQFGGLVAAQNDHRPVRGYRVDTDNVNERVRRAIDVDRDHAIESALVEKAQGVTVADRTVAELDRDGIAVVQHVDIKQCPRQKRVEHHGTDNDDQGCIDGGTRTERFEDFLLSGDPALDIDVVVVADQACLAADLFHHRIASVDAKSALDAAELGSITDIDAGGTDRHALVAVDAVADLLA